MLRSIGIVVGSYLLSIVLVLATGPLLSHLFPGEFVKGNIPSNPALMTSTALFIVISILCAGLCAVLSAAHRSRHVLWFFILGEVMGIAATIPNWSRGWPHWYSLSWLLAWPVSCWLGLVLAQRVKSTRTVPAPDSAGSGV
jgi:hypothetical protein